MRSPLPKRMQALLVAFGMGMSLALLLLPFISSAEFHGGERIAELPAAH